MQHGPTPENDGRSEAARAYQWASEIVSVALVMVGPPLLGWYVSRWLGGPGWQVAWISLGGALGLWMGIRQLLAVAGRPPNGQDSKSGNPSGGGGSSSDRSSSDRSSRGGSGGDELGGQAENRRRSDL